MAKNVKNKYSLEADDFNLASDPGMGGGMGGGLGMDMGGGFGMGGSGIPDNPSSHANGLYPQDTIIVRGLKRLRKLLGISFPKDLPKLNEEKHINIFAYTPSELKYQPGFSTIVPYADYDQSGNATNLYDYLNRTVQQSASWEKEARSTNILSPEIAAARDIMVSSIMSPVDLQTDNVSIVVDGSNLSAEIEEKVSTILTEYFNDEVNLGKRMTKWIGEALYSAGAAPILILPQSNIYTMNKIIDADELAAGRDPEDYIKGTKRPMDSINGHSNGFTTAGESLYTKLESSFESINISPSNEAFLDRIEQECLYSVEKMDFISSKHKSHIIDNRGKFKEGLKEVLENGKNWIRFSDDPSLLRKHSDSLNNRTKEMQKDIDQHLIFNHTDPTYVLNTSTIDGQADVEAASIIELPYQSVIPIIVPGAPNQHIGYFVAVNQWGEPITPDSRDMNNMNAQSRVMEANMQAHFGTPSALAYSTDMSSMQRFKTTSAIFGIMLRNFMQQKLEEYGLGGTQVEQHETITACLFRNLLDKKRIGLIFVPEPMMIYYRFDVHPDGTGKSVIEDMRTITGLRTTLVTAGIMAATENSIDQKIIELNVDEKNANVQQMLEQVKNAFIEKRIMRYDNNPLNVQRELIQKSLMLVPKGIKGLQDSISVNTEHKSQGSVSPDDNLLKQLTDWVIMGTKVPASAINKTSEDDYARSIVTTNLFFNNRVKILQKDVNAFTTKLIRTYIKYNTVLQDKLTEILKTSNDDYREYTDAAKEGLDTYGRETQRLSFKQLEKAEKEAKKLRKTDTHPHQSDTVIEKNKNSIKENLLQIIDHVFCKLPEPRIVVDKAQYQEVTNFADCLDRVCNLIYSEEMLTDTMQEYLPMLKVIRSRIKERLIREFVKHVGFQSIFDLPKMEDIDIDDSEQLLMLLINQKKGLDNIKEQIGDKIYMSNRESGVDSYANMGGGMDMGGGFDMGSGGDMNPPPMDTSIYNTNDNNVGGAELNGTQNPSMPADVPGVSGGGATPPPPPQ